MKRIVILTQYFLPETGAPQSRLYETALGLIEKGWEVRIVTAMPNYPTGKVFSAYRGKVYFKETLDGIELHRYPIYASNSKNRTPRILSMMTFSFSSMLSVLSIAKFKPAYIITESPPLTLGFTGLMLAKLSGAKHILNVADIWPLSAYKLGAVSNGHFYNFLRKVEVFLYKHSFAATGQSQQIVDYLSKEGCNRVHLYRNGVNISRFKQLPVKQQSNTLRIVYTGLLGMAQGILEICKQINFSRLNALLNIYGDGAEKTEIEAFIAANPDRGIVLHKVVSRDDVPSILSQNDVSLIPLIKPIYGAIPSKIYESMAAGLPIIFAGGGEGAHIIIDHKLGWVCKPGNYSQIADKITAIKQMSPDEFATLHNNCKITAEMHFSRQSQIDSLNDFLTESKSFR